ncbi:hypothetical protein V502_07464 [Pseudogymnoascus sp. VKM F-4520 (FW-2644)]|nr:hypothetical protein V502_07464 [Pseudogymnoascus sp. VKM F-4520 (FW-2644)]
MAAILKDDTKITTLKSRQMVSTIPIFHMSWARNLSFLTYDDEGDENDDEQMEKDQGNRGEGMKIEPATASADPVVTQEAQPDKPDEQAIAGQEEDAYISISDDDDEQKKLDLAIAISLTDYDDERNNGPSSAAQSNNNKTEGIRSKKCCETCLRYPRFPRRKKATKFRVIQFKPEDFERGELCHHYIAVSYCWRSDGNGKSTAAEKSYRVRVQQGDGSYIDRMSRTPNEIIDRAVAAARATGPDCTRLIWIDQECLPQDDGKEKEMGIQSMDIVYQRAQCTIGLFESVIQEQIQLDVVAAMMDWGRSRNPTALSLLQHALELFKVSRKFLMSMAQNPSMSGELYRGTTISFDARDMPWFQRAAYILDKVDNLYPVVEATNNPLAFFHAISVGNFGPRKLCNAAVALYFLRSRFNHRPADPPIDGPSWALPFYKCLPEVRMKATRAGCSVMIRTATLYSFSESGLTLPAYAWNVNRSVDLTPIKVKWESLWNKFTCYTVEFEHRDGESREELQARKDEVSRQVREAHGLEQSFSARSDETGDVFQPDPAFGAIVSRVLSVGVVERDEEIQRIVGNIFLDILRHLYYNCEVSLANSIWHSVRAECVVRKEGSAPIKNAAPLDAFPDDSDDENTEIVENATDQLLTHKTNRTILETQITKQIMAIQYRAALHETSQNDQVNAEAVPTMGSFITFVFFADHTKRDEREINLQKMVAAFDVDGSCLVVTPFDSDMERLPHPALRSMATAWVVKREPDDQEQIETRRNGSLSCESSLS